MFEIVYQNHSNDKTLTNSNYKIPVYVIQQTKTIQNCFCLQITTMGIP